jgi:hypothetical protein
MTHHEIQQGSREEMLLQYGQGLPSLSKVPTGFDLVLDYQLDQKCRLTMGLSESVHLA